MEIIGSHWISQANGSWWVDNTHPFPTREAARQYIDSLEVAP